jgi:nitrogen regulatory protein P-II 1
VVQTELLEILLRPEKVEEVLEILDTLGVECVSLSQVQGVGRQRGHTEIFRGREYAIEPLPKIRIEVLVDNAHRRDELIHLVRNRIHTGRIGDGKVFVMRVDVPGELKT